MFEISTISISIKSSYLKKYWAENYLQEIFEFYSIEFKISSYSVFNSSASMPVLLCLRSGRDPNFTYISKEKDRVFFQLKFGKLLFTTLIQIYLYR